MTDCNSKQTVAERVAIHKLAVFSGLMMHARSDKGRLAAAKWFYLNEVDRGELWWDRHRGVPLSFYLNLVESENVAATGL